jgi:hypothetical protein
MIYLSYNKAPEFIILLAYNLEKPEETNLPVTKSSIAGEIVGK